MDKLLLLLFVVGPCSPLPPNPLVDVWPEEEEGFAAGFEEKLNCFCCCDGGLKENPDIFWSKTTRIKNKLAPDLASYTKPNQI